MKSITVYNMKAEKVGEEKLQTEIFDIKVNESLLHRYVEIYLGNIRKNIASAKGRSDVRGGGRKPWKQKGTGRARAGSIRSPLWRGGGVTFGPSTDRNYNRKLNKKEKQKALLMALSLKFSEDKLFLVDTINFTEIKTKLAYTFIDKLKPGKGKILLLLDKPDEKTVKSFRNIADLDVTYVGNLNAYSILRSEFLILSKDSLDTIIKLFGK